MLNSVRLLDQFLGNSGGDRAGQKPGLGGVLGGGGLGALGGGNMRKAAVAAGLASLLLGRVGRGRSHGPSALKLGGLALIGSLAFKAYRNWEEGRQATAARPSDRALSEPPQGTPFNPSDEAEQQALGRKLLRSMIAAAKADGHVDEHEQQNIFAKMDALKLEPDDKAFIIDELRAPLDIDKVADSARNPQEAAEIYTAALLTIDVDNPAERGYLDMLAARLKLDAKLVEHLHAMVEGATEKTGSFG